jgi:hypothetical protein
VVSGSAPRVDREIDKWVDLFKFVFQVFVCPDDDFVLIRLRKRHDCVPFGKENGYRYIGELVRAQIGCIRLVCLAEEGGKNNVLWSERVESPLKSQNREDDHATGSDPKRGVLLEDPEGDDTLIQY